MPFRHHHQQAFSSIFIPPTTNEQQRPCLPSRRGQAMNSSMNAYSNSGQKISAPFEILTKPQIKQITSSFQVNPFTPFLIQEPNIQTIFSNFYPYPSTPTSTRISLRSSDNLTQIYVDVCLPLTEHEDDNAPIVVLLPGMESNSKGTITKRTVNCFRRAGFKVNVLNYRSCNGDPNEIQSTLRLYNAGFTEDLLTLLEHLQTTRTKQSPIYLFGFSLGSSIVINTLGRYPEQLHRYGVVGAGAVAVPFDPASCVGVLDVGWKGMLYSSRLVSEMRIKVKSIISLNPSAQGNVDMDEIDQAVRVGKMDEALVAPVFGYRDRFDYYEDVDPRRWLKGVDVPLLVLNSRDDPFYVHETDFELDHYVGNEGNVRVHWSQHGGHCAFVDEETMMRDRDGGYFQREMARWFQFIDKTRREKFSCHD